jgi:D-aminoacyl-tRNA deacylase
MRAVVQRVSRARVTVKVTVNTEVSDTVNADGNGEVTGEIGLGLLVLVGVDEQDTRADADYLVDKIIGLRIFEDASGKMNLPVGEVGGALLVISQFTLYGDVRRGKRPSFDRAARPEHARSLYEYFVQRVRAAGLRSETGRFQETMQVELVNEGPVTILLDSAKLF